MSDSDSMFLIDISVKELYSYVESQEFYMKCQFGDMFNFHFNDPNEINTISHMKKRTKRKNVRGACKSKRKRSTDKPIVDQSIVFKSSIHTLIDKMQNYPLELSLWDKDNPYYRVGLVYISWGLPYVKYLHSLNFETNPRPVLVSGEYYIFDEYSSRRMAAVILEVKLREFKELLNEHENIQTGLKVNDVFEIYHEKYPINMKEETGTIKTTYSGGRQKWTRKNLIPKQRKNMQSKGENNREIGYKEDPKTTVSKNNYKEHDIENTDDNIKHVDDTLKNIRDSLLDINDSLQDIDGSVENMDGNSNKLSKINSSIVTFIKSDSDLDKRRHIEVRKSKSYCLINEERYHMLNLIYGSNGPFANNVYCVNYFTVQPEQSSRVEFDESGDEPGASDSDGKCGFKFRVCADECPSKSADTCSVRSTNLPAELADSIVVTKCKQIDCQNRIFNAPPIAPDRRILIQLPDKIEEISEEMIANMTMDEDKCFCTCECTFGFIKKTTYCNICGGYEKVGEDLDRTPPNFPFPCPVFHKLIDKIKKQEDSLKSMKLDIPKSSKSNVEKPEKIEKKSEKTEKIGRSEKIEKSEKTEKSVRNKEEPEKDRDAKKKKKNQKTDDRFKFNYGYKGIPAQIGHGRCLFPCSGGFIMGGVADSAWAGDSGWVGGISGGGGRHRRYNAVVPKGMGWLWTAGDVPGIKFRPNWKPGAANKHVVRMLKMAKHPGEVIKKRKRDIGKKKRPLKRPLLVVHKKQGEYAVTMETMKTYAKPRQFNQQPYDDKPLITYTIGRTDEENMVRKKKKEREQRRLERCQREYIQSAFRDMCKEICLKTYQQALGLLPGDEDPECICYPLEPGPDKINLDHSCSCSEDKSYVSTDTDSDEWIIEFTPPVAFYDPTYKGKKVSKVDGSSQYNYMDYKVNLLDAYGNPVPRHFKGPDGKTQCSDLGGFWAPNNKWLEINTDGYVALDGKWAPMTFSGPNGEPVDTENGKFQAVNGKWLMVGIDGFVDSQGKWKFYPKPKALPTPPKVKETGKKKDTKIEDKKEPKKESPNEQSQATWSCFGDATPQVLSKMGIVGHGHDKKLLLSTLNKMRAHGQDIKIPEPSTVPRFGTARGKDKQRMHSPDYYDSRTYFLDRMKCNHPVPSDKGIVGVDKHGHKTYFKLKDYRKKRPKERMANLSKQGISLSSFHEPCFDSFISSETMKQQLLHRRMKLAGIDDKGSNLESQTPRVQQTPIGPHIMGARPPPTGPYPTGPTT